MDLGTVFIVASTRPVHSLHVIFSFIFLFDSLLHSWLEKLSEITCPPHLFQILDWHSNDPSLLPTLLNSFLMLNRSHCRNVFAADCLVCEHAKANAGPAYF